MLNVKCLNVWIAIELKLLAHVLFCMLKLVIACVC